MRLEGQVLEEKNRSESLESFTSTISHEFKTPIGTTLMFLETLLTMGLNKQAKQIVELMMQKLNLLLHLVHDILDMKLLQEG